jgi:hypothetical protein
MRYPAPPDLGENIFVFGQNDFVSDAFINTLDESGFVRVLPSGVAMLPPSLNHSGAQIQASEIRRIAKTSEVGKAAQ